MSKKALFFPSLNKVFKVIEESSETKKVDTGEGWSYSEITDYTLLSNPINGHNLLIKRRRNDDDEQESLFDVIGNVPEEYIKQNHNDSFIVLSKTNGMTTDVTVFKERDFNSVYSYLMYIKEHPQTLSFKYTMVTEQNQCKAI